MTERTPLAQTTALALAAALGFAVVAWRMLPDVDAVARGSHLRGAEALMFEPTGNSPPLVFAATLWLLWRRWPRLRAALGCAPLWPAAFALLGTGAALCLWAYYVSAPQLLLPALTLAMLGTGFWLGGAPGARALLLPAVFVLVAFPIPAALINRFMYPLQLFTANTVSAILEAVGLPARVQGDLIFREGATFQVIESCGGLRTVETMVMSAFLYHDLFYRSRLQSWLLFLAAPFVGIFSNLLRVIGIVLNPYSKFAAIHTLQGLVMIVVAVLMLAAIDALLTRWLPAAASGVRTRIRSTTPLPAARAATLAGVLALLAAASIAIRPWSPPPLVQERALSSFPTRLADFDSSSEALDREFYGSTTFSEWVHRRYEREGEWVEILLGSDWRLDPFVNPVSPKTAVPGAGHVIESRTSITLDDGTPAERLVVHSKRGRLLVYYWTIDVARPSVEVTRALFSLDRGPLRRDGRALVVRLVTPAVADAEERLQRFAGLTRDSIGPFASQLASASTSPK